MGKMRKPKAKSSGSKQSHGQNEEDELTELRSSLRDCILPPPPKSTESQGNPEILPADIRVMVTTSENSRLPKFLTNDGFINLETLVLQKKAVKCFVDFIGEEFDAVVDDGILARGWVDLYVYICEVKSILKVGGKFICITPAKTSVLDLLFTKFRFGWKTSVYGVPQQKNFLVVFERDNSSTSISEISLVGEGNLFEALVREKNNRAAYISGAVRVHPVENLILGAKGPIWEYEPGRAVKLRSETLNMDAILLDTGYITNNFVVYVLPMLRVSEWIYKSEEWQRVFAESFSASRLLMIFMDGRSATYLEKDVDEDIARLVKDLAPGTVSNIDIFQVRGLKEFEIESTIYESAEMIVSRVEYEPFRDYQLRILTLRQTVSCFGRSYETLWSAEQPYNCLVSKYQNDIAAVALLFRKLAIGKSLAPLPIMTHAVVLGLGTGLLPAILKTMLVFTRIEVFEACTEVLEMAEQQYGFVEDDMLRVHAEDGVSYISANAGTIDLLIIDVPRMAYCAHTFLDAALESLSEKGVLIMSVEGYPDSMKELMVKKFSSLYTVQPSQCLWFGGRRPIKDSDLLEAQESISRSSGPWAESDSLKKGGIVRVKEAKNIVRDLVSAAQGVPSDLFLRSSRAVPRYLIARLS